MKDGLEDRLKKIFNNYWKLAAIAGVIILLDQYTKSLVMQNIPLGEMIYPIPVFESFFRFIHWYNTGVAFGMFQGMNDVFKVLAIIVALIIIYYYPRVPDREWPLKIAMCMQLAGAVGNLIDRIVVGYVVDFISVGNFPVFNIADSSITVGVAVLIVGMWIQDRNEKQRLQQTEQTSTEEIKDCEPKLLANQEPPQ
jgi:signal peptidase II